MNFEQIALLIILAFTLGGGLFLFLTSRISDKECRDLIHSVYRKQARKQRRMDHKVIAA